MCEDDINTPEVLVFGFLCGHFGCLEISNQLTSFSNGLDRQREGEWEDRYMRV